MTNALSARPLDADMAESSIPLIGERVLSVIETAERLRLSTSTIYRMLNTGSFPVRAFRIGRSWRIDADALDEWVRDR